MHERFPKHLHMATARIKQAKDTESNLRRVSMARSQADMKQSKQNNIAPAYHPPGLNESQLEYQSVS